MSAAATPATAADAAVKSPETAPAAAADAAAAKPAASGSDDEAGTDTSETVHVLKANKSTGIKSSYYHFSSTPAHEAERYKPQLITDPNSIPAVSPPPQLLGTADAAAITAPPSAATVAAAAPQAIGGSRWNAAGTWEDNDISQWAHDHFKKAITAVEVPAVSGKVTGFERIAGDCTIIFSRGKRRHGYDISALANFTARVSATGAEIKGTLEFPEIADSVADEPWQILISIKDPTADTKAQGEDVYDAFKKQIPAFRKAIDQWVTELKAHNGY